MVLLHHHNLGEFVVGLWKKGEILVIVYVISRVAAVAQYFFNGRCLGGIGERKPN